MRPWTTDALLVIDVQRDFCAGGSLAVPEGDRVVEPLNHAIERCIEGNIPIYATRDWHPLDTRHFKNYGGPWPRHCVANTTGAQFHPELRLPRDTVIVSKGQNRTDDGYSAFEGTTDSGETLKEHLQQRSVRRLSVGGLATDYCVRQTVLDALENNFCVELVLEMIAGVELRTGDSARALRQMQSAGAKLTRRLPP